MNFFFYLALFALIAIVIYNVISYVHATGTVLERLAYAWKGSLTIFALVWSTIAGAMVNGADWLSSITGDPQFATIGAAIKSAVGTDLAPWVGIGLLAAPLILGSISRTRTLGKTA